MLHGLIVDIFGVDTIRPIFRVFHLMSNIPQPTLLDTSSKKPAAKSDEQKKKE